MPRTRASSHRSPLEVRRPQSETHHRHDNRAGCIFWLPKKDYIDERLLAGIDIDDGCFNHPVVVLSIDPNDGKATVLIVSILVQSLRSSFTL